MAGETITNNRYSIGAKASVNDAPDNSASR